jgi:ABC-type Fe3+/spermidine/putrescine transport system ATPase subunit
MPDVELINVTKTYGKVVAVKNVSLMVKDKEYVTLLGASGCGKTTTLRLIAGLTASDEGKILIDGRDVTNVPPEDRGIGFVFQNYALFPHMDLWGNTTYGPTVKGWSNEDTEKLAKQMLEMVRLSGREDAFPNELSGGMQQRASLARALSAGTQLLLLDEPLGALDAKLRVILRYELRKLVEDLGLTAIHVTHDQEEAMTISDKIVVMRKGSIEQVGTPQELYLQPKTPYIANFIGEANFLNGTIMKTSKKGMFAEVPGGLMIQTKSNQFTIGDRIVLAVRPEYIKIEDYTGSDVNIIAGKIERIRFIGGIIRYEVRLVNDDLMAIRATIESKTQYETGDKVSLRLDSERIHVFPYPKEGLLEAIRVE